MNTEQEEGEGQSQKGQRQKLVHTEIAGQRGYFTLAEFLCLAGFSRQFLYQQWQTGKGPPKQTLRTIGKKGQLLRPRVTIPFQDGVRWLVKYLMAKTEKAMR